MPTVTCIPMHAVELSSSYQLIFMYILKVSGRNVQKVSKVQFYNPYIFNRFLMLLWCLHNWIFAVLCAVFRNAVILFYSLVLPKKKNIRILE